MCTIQLASKLLQCTGRARFTEVRYPNIGANPLDGPLITSTLLTLLALVLVSSCPHSDAVQFYNGALRPQTTDCSHHSGSVVDTDDDMCPAYPAGHLYTAVHLPCTNTVPGASYLEQRVHTCAQTGYMTKPGQSLADVAKQFQGPNVNPYDFSFFNPQVRSVQLTLTSLGAHLWRG